MRNQQEAQGVTSDYIKRYKGATKDKEIDKLIKEKDQKEQNKKDNKEGQRILEEYPVGRHKSPALYSTALLRKMQKTASEISPLGLRETADE
jgi:hypothetical protein